MATYKQIQECVKKHFNYEPKTCWIADVKRKHGINKKVRTTPMKNPCPKNKIKDIEWCMRKLGMIK